MSKNNTPIILAVDDNIYNLQVIGNVISNNILCDLRIAKSGKEALSFVEKVIPDLILLDVNMPEMNGFEVCRTIKSINSLKDIPIIFITAQGDTESIVRGFNAGGADYVVKPFDPLELTARVCTHLELRLSKLKLLQINKELADRNEKMEKDLRIAQKVIKDLISMKKPTIEWLNIEFQYMPLDKIGGDYFRFFQLSDDRLSLFLCDVTGHGVPAALFISLIKSITDKIQSEKGNVTSEFMHQLNRELIGKMTSYFITGLYLIFSRTDGGKTQLTFSNGGHPKPILIHNGIASFIGEINTVIGVQEKAIYQEFTISLERGDRLFVYTDGIPETRNRKGEIIGFETQLLDLFEQTNTENLVETFDNIFEKLESIRGTNDYEDDITIIAFDIQ